MSDSGRLLELGEILHKAGARLRGGTASRYRDSLKIIFLTDTYYSTIMNRIVF